MQKMMPRDIFMKELVPDIYERKHAMLLYEELEDYRHAATLFILDGLLSGDKCVMATDHYKQDLIYNDLSRHDIDVDACIEKGNLILIDVKEHYSAQKTFDPHETMDSWKSITSSAVDEGYKRVRAVGEATFALCEGDVDDQLIYYENIINQDLFPNFPFLSLCIYNKSLYPSEVVKSAIKAHPMLIYGRKIYKYNIYYVPPDIFFSDDKREGEIDRWLYNVESSNDIVRQITRNEEKIKRIFNSANDAFYIYKIDSNKSSKIIEVNNVACKMLGYTREEVISMPLNRFVLKPDEELFGLIKKIYTEGSAQFESVHFSKDGRYIPVEVNAQFFELGGEEVIFSVVRDISERQRAEEERKTLENRLHAQWRIARLTEASHDELCNLVLEEIQRLSESQYSLPNHLKIQQELNLMTCLISTTFSVCKTILPGPRGSLL